MTVNVKHRELVVPGTLLAKGDYLMGSGTYGEDDNVYSSLLGLVDVKETFIKVIPLSGAYVPKKDDLVIGTVTDIGFSGWSVDINSAYSGMLKIANATERFVRNDEDLSKIYNIQDTVLAKINDVAPNMTAGLTMRDRGLFKLSGGRILRISPTKVPRVIGKKGTMVSMLKEMTGAKIAVGQNGRVWVCGGQEKLAIDAIRKIEDNAHTAGLTEKIKDFLEANRAKTAPTAAPAAQTAPRPVAQTAPVAPKPVAPTAPAPAPKPVSQLTVKPAEKPKPQEGALPEVN